MRVFCYITILFVLPYSLLAQPNVQFSKEEVVSDLEILRQLLVDAQYDVYAYISEQEFESAYLGAKSSIESDSLNLLETIKLYQGLISKINIGHTSIDFPAQLYVQYAQEGGTVFPLEIAIEYDKPLVRKNWSGNHIINIGSEILSINGVPMATILSRIYTQISAESIYLKNAKLELYSFPRYYWLVFGKQDNFEVETKYNGTISKHKLKAVDVIEGFEMKRTEIINGKRELIFYGHSAYLNPGNFAGNEVVYRQFIDSAFVQINNAHSQNLIVDLRNNGGGNDSFSDYLVSYFARNPFKWNSSFTLKTSQQLKSYVRANSDTTSDYNQQILVHDNGEIFSFAFPKYQPQPKHKQFKGKVYVLVNRQSHSQAAVMAAQVQDYNFGVVVGEETGDYPTLYASIFPAKLPNTGITVNISKGYIVRVSGNNQDQGVVPDIYIKDYLLDEEDEILRALLKRVGSQL